MKKRVVENQQYEEYWKLTLEYSDYLGKPFNKVLEMIVDFIDECVDKETGITSEQYSDLQKRVREVFKKNETSTRKAINQFFKLGFINNKAKSYHVLTRKFIESESAEEKKQIYSQILYDNSSFSRSCTNPADENEIEFLVNTLQHCGTLDKNDLLVLLYTKIDENENGYLTKKELRSMYKKLNLDGAQYRKYNQRNYLFNLCEKLSDVYVKGNFVSITPEIEGKETKKGQRPPYLQHLYKKDLIKEYKTIYKTDAACVLEKRSYPILIASHIKPYKDCAKNEQFDLENGLLLSKNMDSLFDNGYITFDNDGAVIPSDRLSEDVRDYVVAFKLDNIIFTEKRKQYMEYHRKNVFK